MSWLRNVTFWCGNSNGNSVYDYNSPRISFLFSIMSQSCRSCWWIRLTERTKMSFLGLCNYCWAWLLDLSIGLDTWSRTSFQETVNRLGRLLDFSTPRLHKTVHTNLRFKRGVCDIHAITQHWYYKQLWHFCYGETHN